MINKNITTNISKNNLATSLPRDLSAEHHLFRHQIDFDKQRTTLMSVCVFFLQWSCASIESSLRQPLSCRCSEISPGLWEVFCFWSGLAVAVRCVKLSLWWSGCRRKKDKRRDRRKWDIDTVGVPHFAHNLSLVEFNSSEAVIWAELEDLWLHYCYF